MTQFTLENFSVFVRGSNDEGTVSDHLTRFGTNEDRAQRRVLGRDFENSLMPGRPNADLVGTKVFPTAGKKRVERWARGMDIEARTDRVAGTVRGFLFQPLSRIVEISMRKAEDSDRRYSEEVHDALEALADLNVAEKDSKVILSSVRVLLAEIQRGQAVVIQAVDAKRMAQQGQQLMQKLLPFMQDGDGVSDTQSRPTH